MTLTLIIMLFVVCWVASLYIFLKMMHKVFGVVKLIDVIFFSIMSCLGPASLITAILAYVVEVWSKDPTRASSNKLLDKINSHFDKEGVNKHDNQK